MSRRGSRKNRPYPEDRWMPIKVDWCICENTCFHDPKSPNPNDCVYGGPFTHWIIRTEEDAKREHTKLEQEKEDGRSD